MSNFSSAYIFYSIAIVAILATGVVAFFGPETKDKYIQ